MPAEIVYRPEVIKANLDGRTVKWLAGKTGIKIDRLYLMTRGLQEPTFSEIMAIAKALGKDLNTLVGTAA